MALCYPPPVGDVLLLPHGLPVEEVVVGHIWDAAAGLLHDLHGVGVDLSRFLQREKLLHLLQGVFEDHEVASVLWAAIKLIQIVLKTNKQKQEQRHEGEDINGAWGEVCRRERTAGLTRATSLSVLGVSSPGNLMIGDGAAFDAFQAIKCSKNTLTITRRPLNIVGKDIFFTSCARFWFLLRRAHFSLRPPLSCFSSAKLPPSFLLNGASCTSALQSFSLDAPLPLRPLHPRRLSAQAPGGRKGSRGGHGRSRG